MGPNGNQQQPISIHPEEMKPLPCECGSVEWRPEPFYTRQVHRFRADIVAYIKKDRLICITCQKAIVP